MHARREAEDRLGGRYEARVLVPSPPAMTEPPYFADDPVDVGDRAGDRPVISPVPNADETWDGLLREERALEAWCADRWLGGWRRLPDPPDGVEQSRRGLHTLAEWVLSPARTAANGKIGLRFTYGGVGTPFFRAADGDRQVRVDGVELVVDSGDTERRFPLTTLSDAAAQAACGLEGPTAYTPSTTRDDDAPRLVEPDGAAFYAAWFGFSTSVLEELRAEAHADEEPARVQLWPEHFDLSVELGAEADGRRAGFGCSPGDGEHPLPYAYVTPWGDVPDDPYWTEPHFRGARIGWDAIAAAVDQRDAVLEFFRQGRDLLRSVSRK
jgi:hypothetical protein